MNLFWDFSLALLYSCQPASKLFGALNEQCGGGGGFKDEYESTQLLRNGKKRVCEREGERESGKFFFESFSRFG